MTRRFDRPVRRRKVAHAIAGALAHYDFNQAGAFSYEQALLAIRQLACPMAAVESSFGAWCSTWWRRIRTTVKNIAFLMDPREPGPSRLL